MESHSNKQKLYFLIVPRDPERCYPGTPAFIVTRPMAKEDLANALSHYQKVEYCKKEDIQIEKLYMPVKDFEEKRPPGTYCGEQDKNLIIEENNKHMLKQPKSLKALTAKTLAKNPGFFNANKASVEAKEQFEDATIKEIQKKLAKKKD